MQAQLRYMYLHSMMLEEANHRREMEQMKKEIIEEVKASISIWIEEEAICRLRDLLNSLGD